jgi:hypothetical protein
MSKVIACNSDLSNEVNRRASRVQNSTFLRPPCSFNLSVSLMETASNSASSGKPAHSCHRCAVRKVRCDKQQPCAACARHNVECEYRVLPTRRRRKKPDRNSISTGRLEQYGRPLHRKGSDAGEQARTSNRDTSSVNTNGSDLTTNNTFSSRTTVQSMGAVPQAKLLHERQRSKYLDKFVYHDVCMCRADHLLVVCGKGW